MKPRRSVKAAIDKVRENAGLAKYDGPLTPATCPKCQRTFYYRVVFEICPWPGCGGRLRDK